MVDIRFIRPSPDGDIPASADTRFVSPSRIMLRIDEMEEQLEEAIAHILQLIDTFISNGSGWLIDLVQKAMIQCVAYYQIGGSSYIALPKWLKNTRAFTNIKNRDQMCFAYCVLAHIHRKRNPNRAHLYRPHMHELDLSGLTWPMPIKKINIFERNNPDIAINVTYYDEDQDERTIVPLYASKHHKRKHTVNLLLVQRMARACTAPKMRVNRANRFVQDSVEVDDGASDGVSSEDEDDDGDDDNDSNGDDGDDDDDDDDDDEPVMNRMHYVLVRNLSAMLSHRSKFRQAAHVCPFCLHRFCKREGLLAHIDHCGENAPCRISFPSKIIHEQRGHKRNKPDEAEEEGVEGMEELLEFDGDDNEARDIIAQLDSAQNMDPSYILKFKHYTYSYRVPCVVYADFESFIVRNDNGVSSDDTHEPCGYCCLTVYDDVFERPQKAVVYSGVNVMESFFAHLDAEEEVINQILAISEPMKALTEEQREIYEIATNCDCCGNSFTLANHKCRHHCHVTGEYIGPTCNSCNLQLKFRKGRYGEAGDRFFIPIVMHGLRNYDSHIIIKHLPTSFTSGSKRNVTCIASNSERFISFSIGAFRFLDSYQFLSCSLETLASNLANDNLDLFRNTRRHFTDNARFDLLTRKGIYPYEYVDGRDKFSEMQLPAKEEFYSSLRDSGVSDEEYAHAHKVWKTFDLETLQQYHDLYLLTDVLLLSDVFENFRGLTKKYYDLDALHYYTLPGLSFDACLRSTRVRLELLTKPDELLFIERGIRGGVSYICNRYADTNCPSSPDYSPWEENRYIVYLDANNLYGLAQSQPLPISDFAFLSDAEMKTLNIMSVNDDADFGYILEVDLDYPNALHDAHNDYPLAAEHLTVTEDMISDRQRRMLIKFDLKPPGSGKGVKKLIPNLLPKSRYIVHYRNLKFYIEQGMILTKVHKVLRFRQKDWLSPYVEFNTKRRQESKNAFEKAFFKLMINSLFGKLMEQLRQRIDCRIVTDAAQARRLSAKPTFQSFKIVSEDVVIVKMRKTSVYWDKPIYCGLTVLDLSKLHMYDFHYSFMKRLYGERASLLFTDTDSLCYVIRTEDFYSDMLRHSDRFDTSDYPRDHPCYSATNAKVIGKFKDEMNGKIVKEFVGLRSKMYSLSTVDGEQKGTAKGISRRHVSTNIRHEDYRHCLFEEERTTASYRTIRSINQQLMTRGIVKSCLSPYDDKRFFLEGTTDTLSYGHYSIVVK